MKLTLALVLGTGFALCVLAVGGCDAQRREVGLRNKLRSTEETYKADHDAMWKILAQKAQVSGQYGPAQERLLAAVVEGRKGGSLARAVTEANPTFDLALLKDLSQSIEAERKALLYSGKRYQDTVIAYNSLVEDPLWGAKAPVGRLFLGGREPVPVPRLITSGRSTEAAASGVDDDVRLFDGKG